MLVKYFPELIGQDIYSLVKIHAAVHICPVNLSQVSLEVLDNKLFVGSLSNSLSRVGGLLGVPGIRNEIMITSSKGGDNNI